MGESSDNLAALNAALADSGIEAIKDIDQTPERSAYWDHIKNGDRKDEKFSKKLKALQHQYKTNFHTYFAEIYPHLRYEIGEDKTYWNYNDVTGVYEEVNFTVVRGYIIALMMREGLDDFATESVAKAVLAKYRAEYTGMGSNYDDFDNDPDWFHCKNGWIQIHTLAFEPHVPARLSRRVSAVAYDAEAVCPVYDNFIDTQMQLNKDQVQVLDQFSGYLLTPDITQQKMLVLIGRPGSGKSTLLDCWSDVLGDCATQMGLHEISTESFRFRGSTLIGKHLCWYDEVEVTRSEMGNALINLVTGQHIRVERKGINGIVEADNRLKNVLTANTLPRSAEMGIYRRMILIQLEYSFYDNMTVNYNIRTILQTESSGILNRMLRGLASLTKHGRFTTIAGHDDMIEDYKVSSNTVAEFLTEHFDFDYKADPIETKVLLEAYKRFADDKYANSLTPQRFGQLMKNHGLHRFKDVQAIRGPKGIRQWAGLKLADGYVLDKTTGYITEDF
jgi:P4 family phage/plasmid primase-like protien